MKVYVIIQVQADGNPASPSFSVDPVGVCSKLEIALEYVNELENLTPSSDVEIVYDVLEYNVDQEPLMLEWLKKEKKILNETVEKTIIELMKKGFVDQLIGEDGHFYYTLTDLGKETTKSIPEQVKKFFRK